MMYNGSLKYGKNVPMRLKNRIYNICNMGTIPKKILQRYKRMLSIIAMYGYAERLCFHLR